MLQTALPLVLFDQAQPNLPLYSSLFFSGSTN